MPNGGVPMHMVLRPQSSRAHVVYCEGARMKIFTKDAWDQRGEPEVVLDEKEAKAVQRFLRYWAQDSGENPLAREAGVDIEFDY